MRVDESIGSLVRTKTPPKYRLTGTGKNKKASYELRCDKDLGGCGRLVWRDAENLRKGRIKSCNEPDCPASKRYTQGGLTRLGDGAKDPIYQCYRDMLDRCYDEPRPADHPDGYNKGNDEWKDYGGRGIKVCDEWRFGCVINGVKLTGYQVFHQWAAAHGHARKLHLDRPDNDGNYGPNNCRFINRKESARNRRRPTLISGFGGEKKILVVWHEDPRRHPSVSYDVFKRRLQRNKTQRRKWTLEEALTTPVGKEDE